ncbi:MAG: leucine-rich repeat domain-containing protein [Flavobacteriaceae bacterium]
MKSYVYYLTIFLLFGFLFTVSCNNDDGVLIPENEVEDTDGTNDVDNADSGDDNDTDENSDDSEPEPSNDYLALKALYDANPDNTLGWDMTDFSMKSWGGVVLKDDRVTHLDASAKKIGNIVAEIGQLDQLLVLKLSENVIEEIPLEIGNLANLTELHLLENIIKEIPPQMGNLKNLVSLYLGGNQITNLPLELGNLEHLKILEVSANSLVEIPIKFELLSNLKELFLSSNELQAVPEELGKLKSLEKLNLSNNDIVALPYAVCQLELSQQTEITKDPDVFCEDTIEADYYALISLLDTNPGLEDELNWDRNDLTMESWSGVVISPLPNSVERVEVIEVYIALKLNVIPKEIRFLSQLRYLSFHTSSLHTIDSEIGQLTGLENLFLQYNNLLKTIPQEIGNLINLKNLFLNANELLEIPEAIGHLVNLEILDLEGNPDIMTIPQSVCDLEKNYGTQITYPDNATCQ